MKEFIAFLILLCIAGWALFLNALRKIKTMKDQIAEQSKKITELEEKHLDNERKIKKLEHQFEILNTAWQRLDRINEILNSKDDEPTANP